MRRSTLDEWTAGKIGLAQDERLSQQCLEKYQLAKLRETLSLAVSKSNFYRERLSGYDLNLTSLSQLSQFPFTTGEDIRRQPLQFLTVPQGEINRVITLQSSGTTGNPKRLFFTEEDQHLTVDFFCRCITQIVRPNEKVLILLPGQTPGSVGDLLRQALDRLGAVSYVHGLVQNVTETLDLMHKEQFNCIVGVPIQVLALAKSTLNHGLKINSVLLSTDYVSQAVTDTLKQAWHCQVFNHYGSTEMGFGGGVECDAFNGYHMREADLYLEIIDPESGEPVSDGSLGEVVFTTLTRQGMPLIRYRTGDIAGWLPEPCPCGSALRRLSKVCGRFDTLIRLPGENVLGISDLDEAILTLNGVSNFFAYLVGHHPVVLKIVVLAPEHNTNECLERVQQAVNKVPAVERALGTGLLQVRAVYADSPLATNGSKRMINVGN